MFAMVMIMEADCFLQWSITDERVGRFSLFFLLIRDLSSTAIYLSMMTSVGAHNGGLSVAQYSSHHLLLKIFECCCCNHENNFDEHTRTIVDMITFVVHIKIRVILFKICWLIAWLIHQYHYLSHAYKYRQSIYEIPMIAFSCCYHLFGPRWSFSLWQTTHSIDRYSCHKSMTCLR